MRFVRLAGIMVILSAITAFVYRLGYAGHTSPTATSALALGFLLLLAFTLGQVAPLVKAPKITGFLLAGVAAGPFCMDMVSYQQARPLQLVNGLALCLIAFTAGGELKISRFANRLKGLVWTCLAQSVFTFIAVFALFFPLFYFTGLLGAGPMASFIGALLLAVISMANSPATAVAVITETRASGPVTDTVLGVTVIKDVIVVMAFAVTLGIAGALVGEASQTALGMAWGVLHEIGASLAIGVIAGALITGYLKITERNEELFIIGSALVIVEACSSLHASPLLASITAGFVVENFSSNGEKLIKGIETSSAPVYIIFFSLAGQGLDLLALADLWPYALALVFTRMAAIRFGAISGIRMAGEPADYAKWSWTGFVGQAGVSIGFAVIVGAQFPEWGPKLGALVMAGIVINQMAGPVMMKYSLVKSGEARLGNGGGGGKDR